MKQKILKNRGALQENLMTPSSAPRLRRRSMYSSGEMPAVQSISNVMMAEQASMSYDEFNDFDGPMQQQMTFANNAPVMGTQALALAGGGGPPQKQEPQSSLEPSFNSHQLDWENKKMFYTTIPEGQRALISDRSGMGKVIKGPARVWTYRKRIRWMQRHTAYPGEFLIVKFRDGSQKHIPGPTDLWFDPREHSAVEKEDVVQIAAKEAVVVYSRDEGDESGEVARRVVIGPAMFVPEPGQWLHTFSWHGSKGSGSGFQKVPGGLVFQKLWLMPDQMYHDVHDVRTSDDVVLTIRLMLFFELADVEKMLDETHDPIGDFINAASSDVLDLVGRLTFDQFKTQTDKLNDIDNYPQLLGRAKQVGYKMHKIVYRGYATSESLERMHEQAIETRTRLKLERETENQAQELADFKQQREFQRASSSRSQEKESEEHELEKQRKRHEQQAALQREKREEERKQRRLDAEEEHATRQSTLEQWLALNEKLNEMGVDMTAYLTQSRADQVIELRGPDGKPVSPHLHLNRNKA